MRDARGEAAARVGGRFDVRVLEPSPPAVGEAPWFADDPVAGGEVVPVERPGTRSWARLCGEEGDEGLRAWCEQRWLVRGPLAPLPPAFAATRQSLHALAEHVLAPWRHAATGRIGLRWTLGGFGTPFVAVDGEDRQLRVDGGALVVGDRRHPLTTLGEAAGQVGVEPGRPTGVYTPTTPGDPATPLTVDAGAAAAVGDWFGFCTSLLEQLRADASEEEHPSRVQLWPEHFDLAVDLGAEGRRANYGGSPGDDDHAEPYLYVGPWEREARPPSPFWNEAFGASLSYSQIRSGADGLAFLRRGKELLAP